MLIAAALLAAFIQPTPDPNVQECYDFPSFGDAVAQAGGRITQSIETPFFPTITRMVVVTLEGTKEVYAATKECVMVPPVYIDAPDGMAPVPFVKFVPEHSPVKG